MAVIWNAIEQSNGGYRPHIIKSSTERQVVVEYVKGFAREVVADLAADGIKSQLTVEYGHLRLTSKHGVTDWYIDYSSHVS